MCKTVYQVITKDTRESEPPPIIKKAKKKMGLSLGDSSLFLEPSTRPATYELPRELLLKYMRKVRETHKRNTGGLWSVS